MRIKLTAILAFTVLCTMYFVHPALADVAPPSQPPGSNILPGGNTQVQMVAEYVLLSVLPGSSKPYIVSINADFAMRNQGKTD